MLSSLKINDVAIIKEAQIEYMPGLNIMTGETGSGKSIIIDSINAIRGERSSRELISGNAQNAKVTAIFDDVNNDVIADLKKYDIECPDNSVLIQRVIKENGNICKINGENVTVSVLKNVSKHLINVHGQNDNQALLNEDNHILYIDKIANNTDLLKKYKEKFLQLKKINKELKKSTMDENEKERKLDTLNYQINEIENAGITVGERNSLLALKNKYENTEKLINNLETAKIFLDGSDKDLGILDKLNSLKTVLNNLSGYYKQTASFSDSIETSLVTLQECSSFVSKEIESLDNADLDINKIEERLDLIYQLSKKYGGSEEEIVSYLKKAKFEYEKIALNEDVVNKLTDEYNNVLEELLEISELITNSRQKAGLEFSEKIMNELKFLDMPNVKFKVDILQSKITINGADEIKFLISTNVDQEMKPLTKIASGGELSRIMLAIKCVLSNLDNIDTLIFDEIDTGVSGRAAEKIGYKLKEVAQFSQIICVTHLAQIAAFADNHLFIQKETIDNKTVTTVMPLDMQARKNEIARIIGGSHITEATILSAEEMIKRSKL